MTRRPTPAAQCSSCAQQQRQAPAPTRRLRDIPVAADYLDVGPRTIRRYIADGRLSAYRIGPTLLRVDMNEVEALAVKVAPHEVSA